MHEEDHHYTTSSSEVDIATAKYSYKFEGATAYVYLAEAVHDTQNNTVTYRGPGIPGMVPLHRVWFGGSRVDHFFTTSMDEANHAVGEGGTYEGIACYVANQPTKFRSGWHLCSKCATCGFHPTSETAKRPCAGGGLHAYVSMPIMRLAHDMSSHGPNEQNGWSWCHKCDALWFSGTAGKGGVCAAGGSHERTGSGDYTLAHDIAATPGIVGWLRCKKCAALFQSLAKGGHACAAGGQHDGTGSFVYRLLNTYNVHGDLVPLYRMYHGKESDHFYTTNFDERSQALQHGYADEGIACYVFAATEQPARTASADARSPVPLWRIYRATIPGKSGSGFSLSNLLGYIGTGLVVIGGALFFGSDKPKCSVRRADGSIVFYYCEEGPPPF